MNLQQKQLSQLEREKQARAEAMAQFTEQIALENRRQKVALLQLTTELLKDVDDKSAEKVVEYAKVLQAFVNS